MLSPCGRWVIAYNGEIYNCEDLRRELERGTSNVWRGHSDTEVLLAAVARWGVAKALSRTNGMFALALWDRDARELFLARDRLGEKPLYYGFHRGVFLFGSELKALRAHRDWDGRVDRDALTLYLRYNCIPAPYSIYQGTRKLPPGSWLRIRAGNGAIEQDEPRQYWSARTAVETGVANPFPGSESEAEDAVDAALREAVRIRMHADVPVGAFLSGGIDSSTVTAMMQAQASRPVRTFTIGFHEDAYNEAVDAKAVAEHLGTDHVELYLTAGESRDVIPLLPQLYDEPFADSSQIPTYLVSRLARGHVTVCLSGDGGDEVFGGYNRHLWVPALWKKLRWVPYPVRRGISAAIALRSPTQWDNLFRHCGHLVPGWARQQTPGYKLHKLAEALPATNPAGMYKVFRSHWKKPSRLVVGGDEPVTLAGNPVRWPLKMDRAAEQMMYVDTATYLPDDILVKVDRASMGVSLEARVPFLDHRVVELAWTLPIEMKLRTGQGKRILRKVLDRYVPRSLIDRPKAGFGIPIDTWLRGPLRDWAAQLLDSSRLSREGFFDPVPIQQKWREHLSGARNWQYHLWDVLMFQAWHEAQLR